MLERMNATNKKVLENLFCQVLQQETRTVVRQDSCPTLVFGQLSDKNVGQLST